MAEFKLGRIRFVWKDQWGTGNTYYQDDVVAFGGRTYICVLGHVASANFFTDLDIVPAKWNLVSDGQTWKGEWEPNTSYVYNDIVKYGARLYIANEVHTSASDSTTGLEADQSKWDIFAEGLNWLGNWSTSTDYKVNDFVRYGGTTYVANTAHISAATTALGLEDDQAYWDVFNQGIEYKNDWLSSVRYKLNDVVRFGPSLYIANTPHTSQTYFADDLSKWTELVSGFQFEDEWSTYRHYQPGDIVKYGGNQYIAKLAHVGSEPSQSPSQWSLFTEGLKFLGEWGEDSTGFEYKVGHLVSYGGYSYVCIADHTNQEPPNSLYWRRLSTGVRWRGTWLDDQEYLLGDIVRYGTNSYVCVLGHISEGDDFSTVTEVDPGGGNANSRPDLDITGVYWNIIAVGTEQSVLTTKGDLVYFSESGPTRLPVGRDGQVLSVSPDGIPQWADLGATEDVYYVAEHGFNRAAPTYGRSIDKPWRSIRYACEQVDKGVKVPAAAKLLRLNRQFIQREIVEWTDYQIANDITPFTSAFTYNATKCERDMGYIIDAFIWDLTHGGNVKSREVALSYVNNASNFYALGQEAETVASINYGITLIQKVLAQQAPDVNYQTLNGDNSTAIVPQYFNVNIPSQDTVEYSSSTSSLANTQTEITIDYQETGGGATPGGY